MSYKSQLNNGIGCDNQWIKVPSIPADTSVKLAGEEAKDRLYEPKHKKKAVRVLTVIAYVFFVSLAAIMLSLYYVFLWNGDKNPSRYSIAGKVAVKCDNIVAEMQQQITSLEEDDNFPASTSTRTTTEQSTTTWSDYDFSSDIEYGPKSTFIKKLIYEKYPYAEND